MEHLMVLGYTIDDDGVWLWCNCGWSKNLGFEADDMDVRKHADEHRRSVGN